jgi:imidazolonepropionase-like amidohydrolase
MFYNVVYMETLCQNQSLQRPGTFLISLALLLPLTLLGSGEKQTRLPSAYVVKNGRWFNGETFVSRPQVYVQEGQLQMSKNPNFPASSAEAIDLKGAYVTPPFCEAHNHNLGAVEPENDDTIKRYLREGIFYVKILSNLPRETGIVRHIYNHPQSVDVSFANGGITGPGGHPIKLRESLLERGAYEGFTKETLRDHAYFVIDSDADIEMKWPLILQYRPDFIKLLLVFSEEYEKRRNDENYFGEKGLNPEIYGKLVRLSHDHGLRVSTHVNSANDFHVAVQAGSDEIAHLPGTKTLEDVRLKDAQLAAKKGIVVVTTVSLVDARWKEKDPEMYAKLRQKQKQNLRLLLDAGVTLAVGSDQYDATSIVEIESLRELNVIDNKTLLRMWTQNCAQTTFPGRKIGRLADDYEATFLVLKEDPLKDFDATKNIILRMKNGHVLNMNQTAAE